MSGGQKTRHEAGMREKVLRAVVKITTISAVHIESTAARMT